MAAAVTNASIVYLYQTVVDGLSAPPVFPVIDLEACENASTLRRLQSLPSVKTLLRLFSSAGLTSRLGFNMGSGDLSLTFPIPSTEMLRRKKDRMEAVMLAMLGLFPEQEELEALHASRSSSGKLLANECLEVFMKQSTSVIASKAVDFRQNSMKVVICPYEYTLSYASQGKTAFAYSPSYVSLTGIEKPSEDNEDPMHSLETLAAQKAALVEDMILEFWRIMDGHRYMVDVELQQILTDRLRSYLTAGIKDQAVGFAPVNESLSLYLHGTAGIGKSTFVRTFCASLEELLQRRLEPSKRVQIVKVPLNSLTPANLRSILHVRGISDISIERIIEQTVCKGGIVVFHLEENPEDLELQTALFDRSQAMLKTLVRRYAEFSSNVISVFTSNYIPADCIAETSSVLFVTPPSHAKQQLWCKKNLEHRLLEVVTGLVKVQVDMRATPPHTTDLRPLEQWWMSTAFHVSQAIIAATSGEDSPSSYSATVTVDNRGNTQNLSVLVAVDGKMLPELQLDTHNAFFYFKAGYGCHDLLSENGIPQETQPTAVTIVDMLGWNYLKPGVVVLTGDEFMRERYVNAFRVYMQHVFGERLRGCGVELACEDDKVKVFGNPSEIQGGLFKFIASVNNPNACGGRDDLVALVVVECNEVGQFIIRELLECGESRTHRQAVQKDRILFVLSIDGDCTAQIVSRAHSMLH